MTERILSAKKEKETTWAKIAEIAGLSEVFTTSACLGDNALNKDEAEKIGVFLGLGSEVVEALTTNANKGETALTVPKEPLQYRLQEIIYVYGKTIKELIEEKFGAGIMSAVDLKMSIDRQPDPGGDRIIITMNGKFLPYKKW